ncbi:MAG TPA: M50 family metallopeptidase [Candidatus Paceibacterota bacterium]|jgi:regulator of sigma E protease|nr:M50 family metallopeptidase [Candidatus Paceibacterota bacterium]
MALLSFIIAHIVVLVVVLVALIVVHELGHFIVAKLSGMRVDEFGIGYPPRIAAITRGGTEYSINWLPLGGFVRIYGEDESSAAGTEAFSARPKILQALTLLAGIAMNLLFAYVLIALALGFGTQRALSDQEALTAPDATLAVAAVLPGSPAEKAGIMPGDLIKSVDGSYGKFDGADATGFTTFIGRDTTLSPLTFHIARANAPLTLTATPKTDIIPEQPWRLGLGVSVSAVGTASVPWTQAPIDAASLTWELIKETALGLAHFFGSIATFSANLSDVSGPIAIAGYVGDAYGQGFTSLLTITALISINLALINIIPIPALDGGRLLFVLIEAVIRRPIQPRVAQTINAVSFGLLILLMLVVSAHDVFKLIT